MTYDFLDIFLSFPLFNLTRFSTFAIENLTNIGSDRENPIILLAHISATDNLSAIAIAVSYDKILIKYNRK